MIEHVKMRLNILVAIVAFGFMAAIVLGLL